MNKKSILLMFHCKQDTGYAIEKLESVFQRAALKAGYAAENILFSYPEVTKPDHRTLRLPYQSPQTLNDLKAIIRQHSVETIIAFDLPFPSPIARTARSEGVSNLIAYWGASMSNLNKGLKLLVKKAEYTLKKSGTANMYVFESKAMQLTATHGRGIPAKRTCVVPLGVDLDIYTPSQHKAYAKKALDLPENRKIIFYSGHMEERKGVRTIIKAALHLAERNAISDLHFVLCGNRGNEADTYLEDLKESTAKNHVTFAGYRKDIAELMRSSHLGVIASTGWDSFTRSSVEMLSSGLPLIVSNLGGLAETTIHDRTGWLIEPGDFEALSEYIRRIIDDVKMYESFSTAARTHAIQTFSEERQISKLSELIKMDNNE
ncbi:MAG: glycosyltransferase family 4 protein [Reinekea sp.]